MTKKLKKTKNWLPKGDRNRKSDLSLFQGGPVRFGYGLGVEGFERFRFSVLAVLCKRGFSVFQYSFTGRDGSGSGFGSWKTVPAVPVPLSVSGKTVPTVPVSGFGSVPEPPCLLPPPFGGTLKSCDLQCENAVICDCESLGC